MNSKLQIANIRILLFFIPIYFFLFFQASIAQNDITFQVDMTVKMQEQIFNPGNGDLILACGDFSNWGGIDYPLTDPDDDHIYTGTYNIYGAAVEQVEYKFVIYRSDGVSFYEINPDPSNPNFGDRILDLNGNPQTLPVVFFENDGFVGNFSTVTAGDIVNDGGASLSAAWGDYNNDSYPDLFVANLNGENNFLYKNLGDGTFEKITVGIVVNDGGNSTSGHWADYNNDGFLDLFITNLNDNNCLYQNNGDESFTKITDGEIVNDGGTSICGAWADYNLDGFLDLFVTNHQGENNFLYYNNGDGTFTKINDGEIVNDGGSSNGAAWADYDNDGYPDLFVANFNDENNFLYHNLGNGQFERINDQEMVNDGGRSVGLCWGDFNRDNQIDLFVTNENDQNNCLYMNIGEGNFQKIWDGDIVNNGGASRGCLWFDYDKDGDLDLFVCNRYQDNFLYMNIGWGGFIRVYVDELLNNTGSAQGTAYADYDFDGDLDVFLANNQNNNSLYNNAGTTLEWIGIICNAQISKKSAIGTKIEISYTVSSGAQIRQYFQLTGQTGRCSQNGQELLVGLGNLSNIDEIKVDWSSGIVQYVYNPVCNQYITIDEQYNGTELVYTNFDQGLGSLREAINIANTDGVPTEIRFAPHLKGKTLYPVTELPALTEDYTTINGYIDSDDWPDFEISSKPGMDYFGLTVQSAYNQIRGLVINDFNSTNVHNSAILITGSSAFENVITGCFIGTDQSGENRRQNRAGIQLINETHNNIIGGTGYGDRNLISGNLLGGIGIGNSAVSGNRIIGNYIGTNIGGNSNIGNDRGINFSNGAYNNIVGGPSVEERNLIAFNNRGIIVNNTNSYGNTITRNNISNNGIGIELLNGGNANIATPFITGFDGSTLTGFAAPNSLVEIFTDNYDEGEEFLGDIWSDGNGEFSFSTTFPMERLFNVTITDNTGNTSEFSGYLQQAEINVNHWRVQLTNDGQFGYDALGLLSPGGGATTGTGGEFPNGSDYYVLYRVGNCIGTLKNGIPTVSNLDHQGMDFLPGKILNTSPAPIDQLRPDLPSIITNRVYVIDSTRTGFDWDNWPVAYGAPTDAGGDPELLSQQDSWLIYNDVYPNVHSGGEERVLGMEVKRRTYSFTSPDILRDVFFVHWIITNKSANNYTDTYLGTWFDADIDDAYYDLAGSDSSLQLYYIYNGSDWDQPLAFGATVLTGPKNDQGQHVPLSSVSIYPASQDNLYGNDEVRYNLLSGLDFYGNLKPFGYFDFTGNPLTNTGYVDVLPADKRAIISCGPFTFFAGNTQEMTIACIGAEGIDRFDALVNLFEKTKQVREFYFRPMLSLSNTKGISKLKTPARLVINNAQGMIGADVKIHYDPSILELAKNDVKPVTTTENFIYSVNVSQSQGIVSIAMANSNPLTQNNEEILMRLPFKVKNNVPAGAVSNLTFSENCLTLVNDSLLTITPKITNGRLEVVDDYLLGDANLNNTIDLMDAVLILKAVTGLINEMTPYQELLGDINKNGSVTVADAVTVLNQLTLKKTGMLAKQSGEDENSADIEKIIAVTIPPIDANAGQIVEVSAHTTDIIGLLGLELQLEYDATALQLLTVTSEKSDNLFAVNRSTPGYINIAMINVKDVIAANGDVAKLTFKVLKQGKFSINICKSSGVFFDDFDADLIPDKFDLAQNYPNPFNANTIIKYQLPEDSRVHLEIFNVRGQLVETLVKDFQKAGYYAKSWNAAQFSSGVYFYRIKTEKFSKTRKLVLVK